MRMSSVYAVMSMARAPASRARRMARVWVMEMLTGEKMTPPRPWPGPRVQGVLLRPAAARA